MKNKKTLVAFFSHAGENFFPGGLRYIEKGNTHIAAEILAEITESDLFEIQSVRGYSDVYKECVMQAKSEHDSNARPKLKDDIDISGYDVIFIGYPNWCGTMPMPVWTFLENHDFTDKVVCPFCKFHFRYRQAHSRSQENRRLGYKRLSSRELKG